MKSLITFSKYSMKEVCQIMSKDEKKIDTEVENYSEMVVDMMCSKENAVYLSGIDRNVVYYVAGFIARSVKKSIKCKDCANVLGNNAEIRMVLDGTATVDCQYSLDLVNRGGLVKPSDIVFAVCCVAWEAYVRIMEGYEAKSYFLGCTMQRKIYKIRHLQQYLGNHFLARPSI